MAQQPNTTSKEDVSISKTMAYLLRHGAEKEHLTMSNGILINYL
jgi:RNA:NAD 2'-phosphotransferase (TPT1/KptA family)